MTCRGGSRQMTCMSTRPSRVLGTAIVVAGAVLVARVGAIDSAAVRPVAAHAQAAGSAAAAPAVSAERALVNRYCVTCHNEQRKTPAGAPLMLDKADVDHVERDAAVWEKVTRKVRSGAMPPAGMPR